MGAAASHATADMPEPWLEPCVAGSQGVHFFHPTKVLSSVKLWALPGASFTNSPDGNEGLFFFNGSFSNWSTLRRHLSSLFGNSDINEQPPLFKKVESAPPNWTLGKRLT